MQQLLASLVVAMSVKDAAFEAGMASARKSAARTGQDVEKSADRMESAIVRAAEAMNRAMLAMADKFESARARVTAAGLGMTVGVTVPLAVMAKRTKDTAAEFEAGMNRVRAAMLDASPAQIDQLAAAATRLGPEMGRSATEAAEAIESLAKNGMSAATILNGGLRSALTLAVVGQADLAASADLTTDIIAQFGKASEDLPAVVNRVSGALDASKMGFDDYRLALGQAGGVAGGLGVSFEDLNVALAATASTFASGSDAGTSFKTFLTSLNPSSEEAAKAMKRLKLSFFEANGAAKPLAAVAEELRTKMSNLSDRSKRDMMTTIFGADGMRTAIALMNQGAKGVERFREAIDKVSAGDKVSVLLEGDAAASARLSAAMETLSIKIGSVLLPIFTSVKAAVAGMLEWLSNLPPAFHVAWVAAGALAASIGPLIVAAGILAKVALPLLAMRLGVLPMALAAIVNPLGLVISLLGRLAVQVGASTMIGLLGTRLMALAGPIGVAASLLTLLWPLLFRTATASDAVRKAQDAASAAMDRAKERSLQLATATGRLRVELIAKAKADGAAATAALRKSVADMAAAKAALVRAKAERAQTDTVSAAAVGSAGMGNGAAMRQYAAGRVADAEANLRGAIDVVKTWDNTVQGLITDIRTAEIAGTGTIDLPDIEKEKKRKKEPKGRDAARDQAAYLDELGRLRVQMLEAQAELTGGIEARYKADIAAIEEDRASYARNVALDEGLTAAKRAQLIAAQEAVLDQREQQAEQARNTALERDRYGLMLALNEAQQAEVQAQIDAADSVAGRRAGQLRLLDLQRQHEEAVLNQIIATEKSSSLEYSNALARKDRLDAIYADREAAVRRDTAGPLESYRRELGRSAAAVNESIEAIEVSGFERLNDWMADAATGADSLAKSFSDMAMSIVRDLMRIVIQQQLIKPLADRLTGGGDGGGLGGILGGLGGFARRIFGAGAGAGDPLGLGNGLKQMDFSSSLAQLSYGGGKASGGRVSPGSWYMVGEHGPEPFVPESAGTILPTSALQSGRNGVARVEIVEREGFASRVVGIAGDVSIKTTRANNRRGATMARQRLG